jgi:hypothetical protein
VTTAWTADVKVLEAALRRCKADRPVTGCRVAFSEVPGDAGLHVDVIHTRQTAHVNGWMPLDDAPDGLVHHRRFDREPRYQLLRQIRDMVFAAQP